MLVVFVLIFSLGVFLSLIHFQPLMPALPARHRFHGFLNHFSLAFSELSEIILVWGKVVNLSLILVPVCHIGAPRGDVMLFSPFYLFVLENMSAFQVILPFLKISNVFSTSACLKLTQTR